MERYKDLRRYYWEETAREKRRGGFLGSRGLTKERPQLTTRIGEGSPEMQTTSQSTYASILPSSHPPRARPTRRPSAPAARDCDFAAGVLPLCACQRIVCGLLRRSYTSGSLQDALTSEHSARVRHWPLADLTLLPASSALPSLSSTIMSLQLFDTLNVQLHWWGDSVKNHLDMLTRNSPKSAFLTAFDKRDEVAKLFLGAAPFFPRPGPGMPPTPGRDYVETMCR